MSSKPDDLEAVRVLAETLQPIRWAQETLGMGAASTLETTEQRAAAQESTPSGTDIESFVSQKAPKSDVHFAATVAYYHQFIAPSDQRKDSITKEDLVEAR